jgi:MFS superfamily sulfate permease-like transporter
MTFLFKVLVRSTMCFTSALYMLWTDPSTWVLMVLTMAIPIAQISWSMLFPSPGSTAAAVVGQVLGWILGWSTLQLLATRYVNNSSQVESDSECFSSCELLYLCDVGILSIHPAFQTLHTKEFSSDVCCCNASHPSKTWIEF